MQFQKITRAWFTAIEANAFTATGVGIRGDKGVASGSTAVGRVTMQWEYDEAAQTLTIGCTNKPWLIPESEIESHVTALVNGAEPGPLTA